ncbi:MBL fold metallo-hydrolase [Clostridium estertheticum]|uniref:MBL fold metallo-hydrolase n=1 Tax=Clostridium estertheticum TaxID=238834 RepID=UPI001C0B8433|nr:MBL fold metallo-hydrolase [Clostridium estertheticum]MBU3217155.1 MBL fold metallo-hydrolase [Clostridium estertheticum]WAG55011.1 MBL fold metallo-hydrolase [Clostridium estertheticum]
MSFVRLSKTVEYMYKLHRRNFKLYFKPIKTPLYEPIVKNSIHWVGHATVVINLNDKIIVTDPVTSLNLGELKRLVKPSLNLASINIDYIVLSHGHMDHMNYSTLRKINKSAIVIAPIYLNIPLKILGFKNIVLLNHAEIYSDRHIKVKALKANHDGRRYPWGAKAESNSYIIESNLKKIFFAGDTALTDAYKDLVADVAIMPVGCYKPDEFQEMHCSPEQSFKMFKMTKSKLMIPIHYKTYILAQDKDEDTVNTLDRINDGSIKIIDIGQTVKL